VNYSDYKFAVSGNKIFFSLGAIKGVGQAAVDSIIEERARLPDKKFESPEDFFENVDLRKVNKKTIECLIKAGAFDSFGVERSELMVGYPRYIDRAEQSRKDKEMGQVSLFSLVEDIKKDEKIVLDKVAPWRKTEKLFHEKSVLGFYLSDHPLRGVTELAKSWISHSVSELFKIESKVPVSLLGMVNSLREIITKKGTRMAFGQLEDLTGSIEVVVFPNTYADYEIVLKSEGALLIKGQYEVSDGGSGKILVEEVKKLENEFLKTKKIHLKLTPEVLSQLDNLKEIIERYPGDTPIQFHLQLDDIGKKVSLDLLQPKGLMASHELIEKLQSASKDMSWIHLQQ
jgi:DNA polymerase-3 subunit alpha